MTAAATALWLLLGASAFGADFSVLQPQGYVSDFSNVVNAAHRAELERYCSRVQAQTGAQIALVTIPTLDGAPIEDVANSLFRRWGIGSKEKDEGILLLLVTQDKKMRLEVGYGLEEHLPDGYSGALLRDMRTQLRQGDYGGAILQAAHQIGERIAQRKGVTLDVTIPSRRPPEQDVHSILGMIFPILFLILLVWMVSRSRRSGRYHHRGGGWTVFPTGIPGSWGGSGGGGFGGYDSGDGFGGFGGGDSGGGGASSDW